MQKNVINITHGYFGDRDLINGSMKKVMSVDFNWRQVGSVQDKNGAGEDYERITVGIGGIVSIEEQITETGIINYLAVYDDGTSTRYLNPNKVRYKAIE